MADSDEVKLANDDLSRLLRSSVFPGGVYAFPKRSVTHEMLGQAEPQNPEFKLVSHALYLKNDCLNGNLNLVLFTGLIKLISR
jgi:hypothetical protein